MARFIPYSVAMVTPFTKGAQLDVASVPAVVQFYLSQQVPGLLVSGSTGEQHCMTIDERKQLFDVVATTVRASAKAPCALYAGVAAFKTEDAKTLAIAARASGFDGIMLGFPPYRIPSQREAEGYVKAVAASVPEVPIFLYNNPRRTGFDLQPDTFIKIARDAANVCGLKEAGNPANVNVIKAALKEHKATANTEYTFFSGFDATFVDAFTNHGYTGITSIAGNIYPRQVSNLVAQLLNNDVAGAKNTAEEIKPGVDLIAEHGMIACIKHVLRKQGVPIGDCLPPMLDIEDDAKIALDKALGL
ncbi:hypothetical protein BC940DRAFT_229835 [Gongronella butleri]|nr:hypothetical protein BC940DRAFT_229835 [Gongronella butleri]